MKDMKGMGKQFLVLLRHGQSLWNLENRFTGFVDQPLSHNGIREAEEAGNKIRKAGIEFDYVFTSTLERAYKTAEIALEKAGYNALVPHMAKHDDLRERDYGDLTGQNKDEARARFGEEQVQIWRRSYDVSPPGGESLKDVVEKRVRPYFEHTIRPFLDEGKNVLIAAHGNSLRAMLIILDQETPETINGAEIPTGVPLVFEISDKEITARYFLDDKEDEPLANRV